MTESTQEKKDGVEGVGLDAGAEASLGKPAPPIRVVFLIASYCIVSAFLLVSGHVAALD